MGQCDYENLLNAENRQRVSFGGGGTRHVATTMENVPTIPLTQEEGPDDVHLDARSPELMEDITTVVRTRHSALTDLPLRTNLTECEVEVVDSRPIRTRLHSKRLSRKKSEPC